MIQTQRDMRVVFIGLILIPALFFIVMMFSSGYSADDEEQTSPSHETSGSNICYKEERIRDLVNDLQISLGVDMLDNSNVKPPPVPQPYTINVTISNIALSTCSDRATKRGPHQKVITFIFFGKMNCTRNYFQGIKENVELAAKYYPGWVVRLYHEFTPPDDRGAQRLEELETRHTNLDLCDCKNIPGIGNLKGTHPTIRRFLPMADPLVDIFISRDLDSRLNEREVAAVEDWLRTGLTFHVMRDTPFHVAPILAGMWGGRVHQARELLHTLTLQTFMRGRFVQLQSFDQDLLKLLVWPVIKGHVAQHDSYYCASKFAHHGNMRPFPTRRKLNVANNNVGANILEQKVIDYPCPEACRPPAHQDWDMC